MPGAPLSLLEREEISLALTEDHHVPWAVIGRRVGRHPTTVAREGVCCTIR
jgi:IS30 family transposase